MARTAPSGAMISMQVQGFEEFEEVLKEMSKGGSNNALKRAMETSMQIMLKRARANAQSMVRHGTGNDLGKLLRIPGTKNTFARTRNVKRAKSAGGKQELVGSRLYRPYGSTFIKKAYIQKHGRGRGPVVLVGPRSNTAPHASLLEFGTQPHNIRIPKLGITVRHPGSRPHPVLQNSWRQTETQVLERIEEKLPENITRYALGKMRKLNKRFKTP